MKSVFITVPEVMWNSIGLIDRGGERVHGGDALLGIDEQPFPIERHGVDHQRLLEPIGTARLASMRSTGRNGSSVWVLIQVRAPSAMMISSGAVQMSTSSWVEWSQSGA